MTIFILLAGLLSLAILRWRGYRRSSVVGFTFIALCTLLIATGLPQRLLLYPLQHPFMRDPSINWQTPSVIILLGAGEVKPENSVMPSLTGYARILKTAQLYHACRQTQDQCTIIASGGDPDNHQAQEANVYANALRKMGIAINDIQLEPNSRNTFEEAEYIKPLLLPNPQKQVILVTSAYHLQRSHYIFNAFGIPTIPVASDFLSIEKTSNISVNIVTMDAILHECIGLLYYKIRISGK